MLRKVTGKDQVSFGTGLLLRRDAEGDATEHGPAPTRAQHTTVSLPRNGEGYSDSGACRPSSSSIRHGASSFSESISRACDVTVTFPQLQVQ